MLVSNGTLGRQEGGHAPSWAQICLFPGLPPPIGFTPPPVLGEGEDLEAGGNQGDDNGEVQTVSWGYEHSQTAQPWARALLSGGQRPVRIHLGLMGFFLFPSVCFYLRSCARTLALCRVFVCVRQTRAEDTSKLLQRLQSYSPNGPKTDSCLHLSCLICKIWGAGGAGRVF